MNSRFVVGRDRRRLVLEAVARPDLVDPDAVVGHAGRGQACARQTSGGSIARSIAGDLDLDPRRPRWPPSVLRRLPSGGGVAARRAVAACEQRVSVGVGVGGADRRAPARRSGRVEPWRSSDAGHVRSVPGPRRRQGSMTASDLAARTWSPAATSSSADACPRPGAATDVLHLHRLERDERVAGLDRCADRDMDREHGARHRRDARRPGPRPPCATAAARPRVDVGRRRQPERDAPARDVDVDACPRRGHDGGRGRRARRPATSTASLARRRPRARTDGGPLSRQPPATGRRAAARVRSARPPRRPGVVRDRRPRRPVVGRPDPVERVDPHLARRGRPAGGRASAGTAGS